MTESGDKPSDRSQRFWEGLGPNLGATAAILALNLATGVLLARAFDPEARGEVALVLLWPTVLATVAQLGLPEAVTFHTARDRSSAGRVLGSGLIIATVRAVVVLAITAAILPLILGPHGHEVERAGYVYLGFVPGHAYNLLLIAILNGQERYQAVAFLRFLVIAGAAIPMFVVFALADLTLMTVAVLYVGAQVVTFVTSATLLRQTWKKLDVSRRLVRDLLHYGVRAHLGTLSTSLNASVDRLVVSLLLPVRELGLYTIAGTIAAVPGLVGEAIGYVVLPTIAGAEDDQVRLGSARRFARLTLVASAAIAVPVAVFVPELIGIVFGSAYLQIADVARVLLIGTVSYSTARCLEAILRALNMPWQASLGEVIALGVTGVALAVLLPLFGLMGAALASLLAYSTSMAWMLRVAARRFGVSARVLLVDV